MSGKTGMFTSHVRHRCLGDPLVTLIVLAAVTLMSNPTIAQDAPASLDLIV